MMATAEAFGIVGAGRAGLSIAVTLAEAGSACLLVARSAARRTAVAAWVAREGLSAAIRPIESVAALQAAHAGPLAAVLVAVPDRDIPAVADALLAARVEAPWLHLSAATGVDALRRAGGPPVGLIHPLAALVDPVGAGRRAAVRAAAGCLLTVDGDDAALRAAARLLTSLGGPVQRIAADQRALYHAAAALAANDWVALIDSAERAAVRAGVAPAVARAGLLHLAHSALAALEALPAGAALGLGLTGAVARGDAATVAGHLAALADVPADAALHAHLCLRLAGIAAAAGRIDADAEATVRAAVAGGHPHAHVLDPAQRGVDPAGPP